MTKGRAIVIVLAIVMAGLIAGATGCDLGDVIQARTPRGVQAATGLPESLSLNEAEKEFRLWYERVRQEGLEWRESIAQGREAQALVSQFLMTQLDSVGPTLAGVPVLGPALPLVAGLAGLFVRRPGDRPRQEVESMQMEFASTLQREKEASYNKGVEKGREYGSGRAV